MSDNGGNGTTPDEPRPTVSRRGLVGALGAGLVVGALSAPDEVEAGVGAMQYGALNDAGDSVTTLSAETGGSTLQLINEGAGQGLTVSNTDHFSFAAVISSGSIVGGALAVQASNHGALVMASSLAPDSYGLRSTCIGAATAVDASSEFGVGVRARSGEGTPLVIVPTPGVYDPPVHNAEVGTVVLNEHGGLFLCTESGPPPVWRTIFHKKSGAFYPINPVRPYDSRNTLERLQSGESRVVEVGSGPDETGQYTNLLVPYGITAVAFNITVTQTAASGFLSICAADRNTSTSIINWTSANQNIANASVIPVDENREVKITCGGVGSTHFILDISGYYY
ncbi:MAG: hypothetical protein Q8M22_10925 [Actinomycetota bacterium]|nr:hypothetical protein [Actinomycetota bacterium]